MDFARSLGEDNRVLWIAECLIAIAALSPTVPKEDVINFINVFEEKERVALYYSYIVKLLSYNKGNDLFQMPLEESGDETMYDIANAMVRHCCLKEITLVARPEHSFVKKYPLGLVYSKLFSSEEMASVNLESFEPIEKFNIQLEHWHNYFFMTLFNFLCDKNNEIVMFCIGDSVVLPIIICGLREYAQKLAAEFKSNTKINPLEIYSVFKKLNMRDNNSYAYEQYLFTKIMPAIALISLDVFLLSTARDSSLGLTLNNYNLAKQNNLWKDRAWWNLFSQWALPLLGSDMVKGMLSNLIESNGKQKKKIWDLADDSIHYAQITLKLGFNNLAQKSIEHATKVILGYGRRKDLTVYGMLYAIEDCAKHGVGPIKQWLERVAPFTTQIADYTDNDEERHAPRDFIKLVAQYYPQRLLYEFQYYLRKNKRELVDAVLVEFLKASDFSYETHRAVARCVVSFSAMEVLKKRSVENSVIAMLYQEQLQLLGGHPVDPYPEPLNTGIDLLGNEGSISVESFPPKKLNEFINAFESSYVLRKDHIQDWIQFWTNKGPSIEILTEMEKIYNNSESLPSQVLSCFDEIFELSLKLEGKIVAQKWAIRYINNNFVWNRNYSAKNKPFIIKIAKIYKDNWMSFYHEIREQTKENDHWRMVVPTDMLVTYLLAVGQTELAAGVTEKIVASFEEDVAHLSLSPLHWCADVVDAEQVGFYVLLELYKYALNPLKERCADQMTLLLSSDVTGFLKTLV